jgi:6-phosphofructokinase 1
MKYVLAPLSMAANTEQKVPLEWILPDNKGLSKEFVEYALPLIQGDDKAPLEDGLPRFANLKLVRVPKK